jgi:hypothetical protein
LTLQIQQKTAGIAVFFDRRKLGKGEDVEHEDVKHEENQNWSGPRFPSSCFTLHVSFVASTTNE